MILSEKSRLLWHRNFDKFKFLGVNTDHGMPPMQPYLNKQIILHLHHLQMDPMTNLNES